MSESAIPIPGYRIDECISIGSASTLYRGRRELDGAPVVLKAMNAEYPQPEELTRYRHEHAITRALADLIPDLALIIGPQAEVPELGPVESQNRFNGLFQHFIHLFCSGEHPLVLFLDDLQWVDSATLKLLALVLTDEETRHLLVIGAYRDNVVDLMIAKLRRLPPAAQDALRLAACMGNRFHLDTLALVSEQPLAQTWGHLLPVLQEGLVLPLSEPALSEGDPDQATLAVHEMRFLHDRVQQAAYALTPEAEKPVLFYALTRTAIDSESDTDDRREILAGHLEQLASWAKSCPDNFQAGHRLVAAEIARIEGHPLEAMDLYDQAIAAARKYEDHLLDALSNELAGNFWLQREKPAFARPYLQHAHAGYRLWGAEGKARRMQDAHPKWLRSGGNGRRRTGTTSALSGLNLDLASVMKASQVLSGELVLERLLERLLSILIENSGAVSGLLLLERDGDWTVSAEQGSTGAFAELRPDGLIRYVERTGEKGLELVMDLDPDVPLGLKGDPLRLTEMMGGEICVESVKDRGSTFWFTARLGVGPDPKSRAPRRLPCDLEDLRVLVVDDNPTSRTILARYLEGFGFTTGPGRIASAAQLRGARLLLVEDNDINRQVAVELLGQAGIEVTLEDSDAEATEVAEELEPLLRNSIQGQYLGRLIGQIADFDFEAALETLRDIEERQV